MSGSEWSYNAWKWLCREAAKGSSNEDIALTISSELTIAYYSEARFVIFVGDEGVENDFKLDQDNVDYGNLQFTQGTVFENQPKCRILILAFSTNFCTFKIDLSGNTV